MTRRSDRPNVLCVTHRVPFPPDRGDRIRTWNVLKFLSQRAHVDLISLSDDEVTDETLRQLKDVTRRLAVVPRSSLQRYAGGIWSALRGQSLTEGFFGSRACRQIVHEWSADTRYGAAYASSSGVAQFVLSGSMPKSARVWIDMMDVDSQKWLDYSGSSRFPMSLIYGLEGRRTRQLESKIARTADRILVVTEAERQLFLSFSKDAPVDAVGNGVDLEYFSPAGTPGRPWTCAFVGVMDYRPNVDAVCWFAREVWPLVKQRYPDARFDIVGKSPTTEVRALESLDGIHVTGPVKDVRPWLHEAACIVVPLRIARGVQNKVLEAMACGRPIVCSPAPLQGLNVERDVHLLAAETPAEWLKQISHVFDDPCRASELGTAASCWVQMHHRWDACLEPLHGLTAIDSRQAVIEAEMSS